MAIVVLDLSPKMSISLAITILWKTEETQALAEIFILGFEVEMVVWDFLSLFLFSLFKRILFGCSFSHKNCL